MNKLKWLILNFRNLHVALAVKILIGRLKKDKGLWTAYQCNIAMAFHDETRKLNQYATVGKTDWHKVSNAAADRFMHLWTSAVPQ